MVKKPNSRRNLDMAIQRAFGTGRNFVSARTIMANAIVGQMLPSGVVKGGFSLKLRYGNNNTRFTTDLDVARSIPIEEFIAELNSQLEQGWEGFVGRVVKKRQPEPEGVPAAYVMQPLEVKLFYNEKPWVTVPLEVGQNEIGDADEVEYGLSSDIATMFEKVGLPIPGQSPLMPLSFQVAQKIHGLSEPGSKRINDLIDLQIIANDPLLDLSETKKVCIRLFAYRKLQSWPPVILGNQDWEGRYNDQTQNLNETRGFSDAIAWVNKLIKEIDVS